MQVLYDSCCGLDVHAQTVVACLIRQGQKEVRTLPAGRQAFSTMTAVPAGRQDDLLQLSDWLTEAGCTQVAIESTGVYWKPVFNILEGVMEVILVNARHVKAVPGRKTDVKDCEWLADLLRHGLLKASFIPPLEIRELRELTRYRASLVKDRATLANRIQKLAESGLPAGRRGNIKLGQVASDALGVSGRLMLRALARGETDAQKLGELARGRMKQKKVELRRALAGRLTQMQRWVLGELLDRYEEAEAAIERVSAQIAEEVKQGADPFVQEAVKLVDTIPGVGEQVACLSADVAQTIISEIGVRMEQFPTDHHLASWAGMCPGNNESAGKRKSGKTTKGLPAGRQGSIYLREALVQAAWAAAHTKETYLAAQYQRLVKRLGKKKALVAVGHSILIIVYHVLKQKAGYRELGGDYFDRQHVETERKRLIRRLESLGLKVIVEELPTAA